MNTRTPATQPATAAGSPSPRAGWSTPRLLRVARGVAAAAALLTGVVATGTFSADGVNATANVVAQHWVSAERAGVEIAHADLLAAQRVAEGDPEQVREDYDAVVSTVSQDLSGMGDSSGEAATAWASFVMDTERAAVTAGAIGTADAQAYARAADAARSAEASADTIGARHAEDLLTGSRSTLTSVVGALSTALLLGLLVLLALRTRRIINVPLAVAALITAGLTYLSFDPTSLPLDYDVQVAQTQSSADALQQVYAARAAQQAQSWGAGSDWSTQAQQATEAMSELGDERWGELWSSVAATDPDQAGLQASQEAFDELTRGQRNALTERFNAVASEIGTPALLTSGAALALGLIAAALAWAGLTARLRDYR